MLESIVWAYVLTAVLAGTIGVVALVDDMLPGATTEADWAILVMIVLFAPLVVVGFTGFYGWRAVATIVAGFGDLIDQVRPEREPKIPRAKVV